jgi:hypothetical protein
MRVGKRKRELLEDEDVEMSEITDTSEEITSLPARSRSGRRIIQAIIKIDEEVKNTPRVLSPTAAAASDGSTKKKKVKFRRTPGAAAVCKNCGRGHSPSSNVIVFCDECNNGWHQFCHDPPVMSEFLEIVDSEWFCSDCTVLKEEEERLRGRRPAERMTLLEVWASPRINFICLLDNMVESNIVIAETSLSPIPAARRSNFITPPCLHALPLTSRRSPKDSNSTKCL